jgi:hypothetical protein
MKTVENTKEDPDNPELADEEHIQMDYSSNKNRSSNKKKGPVRTCIIRGTV